MAVMPDQPPIVSEAWSEQVRRSGSSEIAEFSQAQLLAAGIRHADPSIRRSTPTTFDELDDAERAAEVERARTEDPGDPEALRLISSVTRSPLFSGGWDETAPSFVPEGIGHDLYLEGMHLADGSPGVLVGGVDAASSRWRYTVHDLGELPRRLAESLFAIKDPDAPDDAVEIATATLGLIWPSGRLESRPREAVWQLVCPSSGSRAHLKTSRNFGLKRSERTWEGMVSEEELAARMLELFEQCAREGGRRR